MKLCLFSIGIFLILSIVLYTEDCHAKPFGNRWSPTDSRCGGGYYSGIRLKRSVTSNNYRQDSYYYKFNPNHGECEQFFGSSRGDYQAFDTESECERSCLNVYHFD